MSAAPAPPDAASRAEPEGSDARAAYAAALEATAARVRDGALQLPPAAPTGEAAALAAVLAALLQGGGDGAAGAGADGPRPPSGR